MNSFWNLTGYEYKKIFRKKSTLITIILTVLASIFSCYGVVIGNEYVDGQPTITKMESLQIDREYARALAGRSIDSALMMETIEAYAKVPADGRYSLTEEYQTYARPYSEIYGVMRQVFKKSGLKFDLGDMQGLTKEQTEAYYSIREEKISENINFMPGSDTSKAKLMELNKKVKYPFVFEYSDGYGRYLNLMFSTGILICLAIAILISPIFSGEYVCGADQLILSSKYGKNKVILSKLFTVITVSGGFCIFIMLITYFFCMLIYGSNGAGAQFQLLLPLSVYPLTMGQAALILSVCILLATLLVAALTMLLSARMKTPFGVIIVIYVLIIAPMFSKLPENSVLLSNLLCMLPTNMINIQNVISHTQFELFEFSVLPYIFMPVFAGIVTIILLLFAYRGFKNHQIG